MSKLDEFKSIFGEIVHIGVVVPDLEPVKKAMRNIYGVEPNDSGIVRHPGAFYRGEPVETAVHIMSYDNDLFDMKIEYLVPLEGHSTWMEWLEKHGAGVHHVLYNVTSFDEAVAYMEERGYKIWHTATSMRGGDLRFAYFDTYDDLGFNIDIINVREIEARG